MAQVNVNISGILKLQKNMDKVIARMYPLFLMMAEAAIKFGVTKLDVSKNTETFQNAKKYYQRQCRKQWRRDMRLRRFRRRGERMRRGK